MRVDPLLALRLAAWRAGHAVRAYTHQRVPLRPHALFVTALQFPGEDNTIMAVAFGDRAHRAPLGVLGTPDPRMREEEAATIGRLHAELERYFQRCERELCAPQLVVTSRGALRHLQHIANDLRFNDRAPATAAFATAVSYFTMRAEVADQQAVMVMTDVLRTHWVTALDPTQSEHLGALLAAIAPPDGVSVVDAVQQAEQVPMSARTTPQFDRDVLQPALARFHAARKRSASSEELAPLREHITRATASVVEAMYGLLHQAADLLDAAQLAVLPQVAAWVDNEGEAFRRFRAATAQGLRMPRTDQPKGGAFRYAEREQALSTVESTVECHDDFGRACAVARGAMVEGIVSDVRRTLVPGQSRRALLVDVTTTQSALRIRDGHELVDRAEHRARYIVRSVRTEGSVDKPATRLTLQMTGGSRAIGAPPVGVAVTLVREVPDLQRIGRIRGALAQKLAVAHWTLGGPLPRPMPPRRGPGIPDHLRDAPRRALELLR